MSAQGLAMTKEKTYIVCTNSSCPNTSRTTLHYRDEDGAWVCSICGSRKRKFMRGKKPDQDIGEWER